MLTAEEIKSIASSGEGYNADFKISVPSKVRELSQDAVLLPTAKADIF